MCLSYVSHKIQLKFYFIFSKKTENKTFFNKVFAKELDYDIHVEAVTKVGRTLNYLNHISLKPLYIEVFGET